jgi:serine/threonine protein kinase
MKICPICRRCYEDTDTKCEADHSILVPSRPGSRVIADKYRLDSLLGRGGMGAVYAALHVELERPTAIKLLLPDLISDEHALERFKREARAAARLNHPNVAGTYDFGTLPGGEAYIVMELVEGETLSERLRAAGALPLGEAVLIARQVADGIESAHEGGIVHRDLKPANIIISRDHRGTALVKVLDFGIAQLKETSTTGGLASITTAGSIMGTPRYMSPEQCSDSKVDARSDIYSLGVLLYEMLAGRPPFDAPSAMALALKQIQEPPPPLSEARPEVPEALERVVMWALAKDPADRPQTAAEFSRALLAAEGAAAHMPSTPSPSPPQPEAGSPGGDRSFRPEAEEPAPEVAPSLRVAPSNRAREDTPSVGGRGDVPAGSGATAKGSADTEPSNIVAGRVGGLPSTSEQVARAVASPELSDEDSTHSVPRPQRKRTRLLVFAVVGALAISLMGIVIVGRWRDRSQRVASEPNTPSVPDSRAEPSHESPARDDTQDGAGNQAGSPVKAEEKVTTQNPEAERKVLQSALAGWVAATNARDVNRQLTYYAPRLEAFYLSRDVPRDAVRAEKRDTFSQADRVSISVDDVAVEIGGDGLTAAMKFRKQYVIESGGGRRRDGEVLQELQWSKTDAGWKITSERDLQVLR